MSSNPALPEPPTLEIVARVYHALSEHALNGVALDGRGCTCRDHAGRVKRVVDLLAGKPIAEPDGLGAVVLNPLTGQVWVRAAHPALPWYDPATAATQEWADPTSEAWYAWEELLPGPLVVQSPGWTPPTRQVTRSAPPTRRDVPEHGVPEPRYQGSVVVDAAGHSWVRLHDEQPAWVKADLNAAKDGDPVPWEDVPQPVTILKTYEDPA